MGLMITISTPTVIILKNIQWAMLNGTALGQAIYEPNKQVTTLNQTCQLPIYSDINRTTHLMRITKTNIFPTENTICHYINCSLCLSQFGKLKQTWTPMAMSESEIPSDEKMSIKRRGILSATIKVMPFDTSKAMPT